MKTQKHSLVLFLACVLLTGLVAPSRLCGQTATSGTVVGTVTDPSGAAIPNASVQLLNVGTNASVTTTTGNAGEYTFVNVAPGDYTITVTASGFRTHTVQKLTVDVNKSANVPVRLEVGAQNQVVEVTAAATAQLQTQDAQIGNVMSTENILRLPTLQRNATELMNLQPGVVASGTSGTSGLNMRVSGAIDDQNTVTLDGIDITQNLIATGTSIPTPADSVEEFRESVANPTASFTRASGAQVALIGRRGTNDFHGALYEYFQNDVLNSNTWDNNRVGQKKAPIRDNRFGGRLGGPIQKDKTFFFANYEGRRFASVYQANRTVPTATLRQGIVRIPGPSGIEQFNLKTAAVCGSSGNSLCDPRGIGLNPSVAAQFADMPLPNLPGVGDGLNTSGYFANLANPVQTDYGVIRLDHVFNEKLTLNTSFTYYRIDQLNTNNSTNPDISILNGHAMGAAPSPERAIVPTAQLTWQITPSWLNVTRIGWVRDTMQTNATSPTTAAGILNIPGSQTSAGPIALLVGSGVSNFIDSPIDMDTQRARYQASWLQDRQLYDDVTKVWGKHTTQFGFQLTELPFTHARADKVLGSITSLVAQIDGDQTYLTSFTQANRPLTCSSSVTTNCLPTSQITNWDRYYASLLGLVDNVSVLAVRNSNLQPQPFGTLLRDVTNQWAPYFYAQDSWRIRPDLTLYYGLSYGWQTSPTEQNNLQTIMINAATGQEITGSFMQQKLQAALNGQIYNPTFGFATVGTYHRPVYNVDYGAVAPRIAVAWNPSVTSGLFKFLGDKKSVIRGGWGMVYDRGNQVQSVEIPMLGIGFDQNAIVAAPQCNATGAAGPGCTPGTTNYGLSSFRAGIDGTLPLPIGTAAISPIVPAPGAETLSFQVDPNFKTGRSYNIDFSYQRELPGGIIMEAAYIGRLSRDLPQSVNVNSAPYMFKDNASGQSFAQAYDRVANALRAGQSAAIQPWFENQFPGLAAAKGTSSATAYIVAQNRALFVNGTVGNLFLNLDTYRRSLGLQAYDSDQAQVEVLRSYVGIGNYNAGVLSLQKRLSRGFMITGNYTYSKALDQGISNQNNAGVFSNSFYPDVQYGPSAYDRRHVVNIISQYDLPAGNGHWLHGNSLVNHIIGGWYISGIFSAWSGVPIHIYEGNNVWGGGTSIIGANEYMIPTGSLPSTGLNRGVSSGTCSNGIANTAVATSVSGTGQDIFSNPAAAYCDFRYVQLSTDGRTGNSNPMYGLPLWNLDLRVGKITNITERLKLGYSADFFNIFNHENFANPAATSGLSFANPSTFGVITSTFSPPNRTNAARWIEMGLRLDF